MMNSVIGWWARNPVAANLLMFGLVLSGFLGYLQMEREVLPTVRAGLVEISVVWPGAAPQEVEEQLVVRIEETLKDLDNVERISATAEEGVGVVVVEANPKVDMGQFINSIKLRVDSVSSFPSDIEPPRVEEKIIRSELIRLAVHGQRSEQELNRIAERVRDEIALLPGISIVMLSGVSREEVTIELSERAMRRYRLSFDDVAAAIRGSSINLSTGSVRTQTGEIQLRARNLAENQADFNSIIVRQSERGGIVTLGDVARVVDGFEDEDVLATLNGDPAVLVQVMSSEKTDVVKVSDEVKEWLDEARPRMPDGVALTLWWDASDIYRDRMSTVTSSAFYGLLLVFAVLILSLRPKIALWVTFGIATAYAGSFALLPASDVSINILSTFAFLLVLGIVVDDAIVVGESIHDQSNADGSGGVEQAATGARLVAKPVVFAVLTTMIAFMPWFFVSGADAQITRHISIVIVLALTISLIEAFFILPAHLSHLKPRKSRNPLAKLHQRIEHHIATFANLRYRKLLAAALERRYLTVSIFVAFFIISVGLLSSGWVRFSFTPEIGNDQVTIKVDLVEGTPHSRVLEVLGQIREAERKLVDEVEMAAGQGNSRLVDNWYARAQREGVTATIKLAPHDIRAMTDKETAERWRELVGEIPDAEEVTVRFQSSQSAGIEYAVSHPDLGTLREAVDALKAKLETFQSVHDVRDDSQSASEELQLSLLPGVSRFGLTLAEVSRQVRQAYYGEEVQRLPRDGNDVKVMLRYPQASRRSLDSLADFHVRTSDGKEIPLMAVAGFEFRPGTKRIDRRERQRSVVVSADLKDNVRSEIQRDLEDNFFDQWKREHPGVSLGEVGEAEGEMSFFIEIVSLYLVALFVMYALIAVAFRSYWQPVIVMIAIPFGFMGAVYGHLVFGVPMTLFSYFGIGAAAGVVVNDNLVLMDFVNRMRDQGMDDLEAVMEAAVKRFRPIVLTSVTTFVGLLPMISEGSLQAQFLKPTVISLAAGVLFATVVTLSLVPALYAIGGDLSRRSARASGQLLSGREA